MSIVTGDRVVVIDRTWHRYGDAGTVIAVHQGRHHMLRVQMDSSPVDIVKGASTFFAKEEEWCKGCGKSFNGERGLRAHQTRPYTAMGCRPVTAAQEN